MDARCPTHDGSPGISSSGRVARSSLAAVQRGSDASDDDALRVFVGTWNVGNVAPQMDACREWLAKARGHDVVAIAAQEASYSHSRGNLSPKTVSVEMRDVPYHVKRLGWLRSSKMGRIGGAVAGAFAGAASAGPFAPVGLVLGAAAGYYSSTKVAQEFKVRNHWFDVVKAGVGPGYRVVQTAVLLQMRIIVLVADPVAALVREVRVGHQATGIMNTIGNKGGLMIRMKVDGVGSMAFVAVHLAAHEGSKHVQARNDSLARIFQGCWDGSTVRQLGGGTTGTYNNGHVVSETLSSGEGEVTRNGREPSRNGEAEGKADEEKEREHVCAGNEAANKSPTVIDRVAATAAAVAQEATNVFATVQEAASLPQRRASNLSVPITPGTSRTSPGSRTIPTDKAIQIPRPLPPELLACTDHVFVFGDLNYRIDPGRVVGRGWNTMWKKGNDPASGSIAAAVAAVAKASKKNPTKAAFAAEDARRLREATALPEYATLARAAAASDGEHGGGVDDDEDEGEGVTPREGHGVGGVGRGSLGSAAAAEKWVEGWHAVVSRAVSEDWSALHAGDQLTRERRRGTALHGFEEGALAFPPTFKRDRRDRTAFSRKRIPSWCDRILFRSLPSGGARASSIPGGGGHGIKVLAYDSCQGVSTSDHCPVYASCEVGFKDARLRSLGMNLGGGRNTVVGNEAERNREAAGGSTEPVACASLRVAAFRIVLDDARGILTARERMESAAQVGKRADVEGSKGSEAGDSAAPTPRSVSESAPFLEAGRQTDEKDRSDVNVDAGGAGEGAVQGATGAKMRKKQTVMGTLMAAGEYGTAGTTGVSPKAAYTAALRRLACGPKVGTAGVRGKPNQTRAARTVSGAAASSNSSQASIAVLHFAMEGGSPVQGSPATSVSVVPADPSSVDEGESDDDEAEAPSPFALDVTWGPDELPTLAIRLPPSPLDGGRSSCDSSVGRAIGHRALSSESLSKLFTTATSIGEDAWEAKELERDGGGGGSGTGDVGLFDQDSPHPRDCEKDEGRDGCSSRSMAARLAWLGIQNVIATLAVEKEPVGVAVVPLADIAAAAAVQLSDILPCTPSSSTVSVPFVCPLVRLGQLHGRAEGTLVLDLSAFLTV